MVDSTSLFDIEVVATFFIGMGLAFAYALYWMRRRRTSLGADAPPPRAVAADRAFNQITLARAAADHLAREGVDVSAARTQIDSAEEARRRGNPDAALGFAQSAQTTLLKLRNDPAAGQSSPTVSIPGPAPGVMPSLWAKPVESAGPGEAPPPRLPPNQAESRFQLGLLNEELAKADAATPATVEARVSAAGAQVAYDRRDFTEALRLALKGRRRLGGRLETLPPPSARVGSAPLPSRDGADAEPAASPGPGGTCARCGQPLRPSDAFCRGCGAPKVAATCPSCGETLADGDRFCGVCGKPISV